MTKLTLAEISFHGSVNSPEQLKQDDQDPSSLFVVPDNVAIMFRGGFGFAQYTLPGVIDTMMGRDPDGESFSTMLKRHNDKFNNFGSLCLYQPGSTCINLALQDESKKYESGLDTNFVITVNEGEQIDDVDVKPSGKPDEKITITSICKNGTLMKYFNTLKNVRRAFCLAAQKIEQGFRYIYLTEVINMLINEYGVDADNKLVVYVSSCQVIDEDWMERENISSFKNVVDTSLAAHDLALSVYNPDELLSGQRGFSEKELEFINASIIDFKDQFYGTAIEGYLNIPDRRGVMFNAWYSSTFPEGKRNKRKRTAALRKKRRKHKKKSKRKSKKFNQM